MGVILHSESLWKKICYLRTEIPQKAWCLRQEAAHKVYPWFGLTFQSYQRLWSKLSAEHFVWSCVWSEQQYHLTHQLPEFRNTHYLCHSHLKYSRYHWNGGVHTSVPSQFQQSGDQGADPYQPHSWKSSPKEKKVSNTFANESTCGKSTRHNGPNTKHQTCQSEQPEEQRRQRKTLFWVCHYHFVLLKMQHERFGESKLILEDSLEKNDVRTTLTKVSACESSLCGQTLLQNNPESGGLRLVPLLCCKFTCGTGTRVQRNGNRKGRRWL